MVIWLVKNTFKLSHAVVMLGCWVNVHKMPVSSSNIYMYLSTSVIEYYKNTKFFESTLTTSYSHCKHLQYYWTDFDEVAGYSTFQKVLIYLAIAQLLSFDLPRITTSAGGIVEILCLQVQ